MGEMTLEIGWGLTCLPKRRSQRGPGTPGSQDRDHQHETEAGPGEFVWASNGHDCQKL